MGRVPRRPLPHPAEACSTWVCLTVRKYTNFKFSEQIWTWYGLDMGVVWFN